jgi:hypothetical protein
MHEAGRKYLPEKESEALKLEPTSSLKLSFILKDLSDTISSKLIRQTAVSRHVIFIKWGRLKSTWYVGHYLAYCTSPG